MPLTDKQVQNTRAAERTQSYPTAAAFSFG